VTVAEAVAIALSGVGAGAINTVVGSGTLITFPVLLAVGYSPVQANVTNTVGLVPGSVTGAWGYRRELQGQRAYVRRFGAASFLGAIAGATLLLVLPAAAFKAIVPAIIAVALALVVAQPWLSRRLAARRARTEDAGRRGWWAWPAVFASGVYGGYFGAAQGILLIGVLGLALPQDLHRTNALKNVLAGGVNLVAGVVFIVVSDIAWGAALLIALGAIVGAWLGARYGRRLPPAALRGVIVVVGIVAIVRLLV